MTTALPAGFRARLRADVARHPMEDPAERLLLGGSPLRAVRLTKRAGAYLAGDRIEVTDAASAQLARQLLNGNLADPEPGLAPDLSDLTIVVPVRDRPLQLDRCLSALAGLRVIVVNDASLDPSRVIRVVERHGAQLVTLATNLGPAGARNAGLAHVETPFVAFVDSDVTVAPATLVALAAYFDDPALALVGPLVRGPHRQRGAWFERYDAAASSLALGLRACAVRPGAAVGWLASACLVGRTEALREMGSFNGTMHVGEDVDLVLRLVESGRGVRYQPECEAIHDVRPSMSGWLGRKLVYGTGAATLAERHGDAVAVARLPIPMAIAGAGVLLRRPWSLAIAAGAVAWSARGVHQSLPPALHRERIAAGLAITGFGWSIRQQSALMLRHWWPAAVLACLVSRTARRMMVTALAADLVIANTVDKPLPEPKVGLVERTVARRLDDLAYGAGLWIGAARARSLACLKPKLITKPKKRTG